MPAVILGHGKALLLSQQQEGDCWWHKVLPTLYPSQLPGSCSRLLSISGVVCTGKDLQSPPEPWGSGLMSSSCFPSFPYQATWGPVMAPSLILSLTSYQCYHYWLGHHCKGNLQQERKHPAFQSSILLGILIKMLSSPSPCSCSLCTLNFCSVGHKVKSLIRPFPWMVLIWFGNKRKGTWQNSHGVLFSLNQSQLGRFFSSLVLYPYLMPVLASSGSSVLASVSAPSLFSQNF